jgi:histidinol dehydrogenase
MRIISTAGDIDAFLKRLAKRAGGLDPGILEKTGKIIRGVRAQGDRALKRYTLRFDGHERLRISPSAIKRYASRADRDVLKALRLAAGRIRRFHEHQKEKSWTLKEKGITLGQIIRPLERVGVYVPGGKASYPSTALMNVIPAQVAGVGEIAVTVPTPDGKVTPHVMAALDLLGIKEVYSIGGAQAVAALAYGTGTVKRVDKITGPGNLFVATAKKMVFGDVDIDMIAGPSEILIIADASADPAFIAADLLSQAEHDELASPVVLTDSAALAEEVRAELRAQLGKLSRKDIARKSLRRFGAVIVVKDLDSAVDLANRIAPEHLEIMTRAPRRLLPGISNAGAVFLGKWTPEPLGDYCAGPNHTLPTGATAKWASALGVYDFIKRTSLIEFDEAALKRLAGTVRTLAEIEGLEAHANAINKRLRR